MSLHAADTQVAGDAALSECPLLLLFGCQRQAVEWAAEEVGRMEFSKLPRYYR